MADTPRIPMPGQDPEQAKPAYDPDNLDQELSPLMDEPAMGEDTHPLDMSREHPSRVDELGEERATHQEREAPWVRPSSLEAPEPRPGMVQRWIRITVRGEDDPRNINMRTREGWRPRPIDSIPEDMRDFSSAQDATMGRFVVDDLLLCEMPEERYRARQRYYQTQTDRQMEAVEYDLENAQQGQSTRIVRTHNSQVQVPSNVKTTGRRVEPASDH